MPNLITLHRHVDWRRCSADPFREAAARREDCRASLLPRNRCTCTDEGSDVASPSGSRRRRRRAGRLGCPTPSE